jgi:hypothetical protein
MGGSLSTSILISNISMKTVDWVRDMRTFKLRIPTSIVSGPYHRIGKGYLHPRVANATVVASLPAAES